MALRGSDCAAAAAAPTRSEVTPSGAGRAGRAWGEKRQAMEVKSQDAGPDAMQGELGELSAGARELCACQPLNCFAEAWRRQEEEKKSCQQISQATTKP